MATKDRDATRILSGTEAEWHLIRSILIDPSKRQGLYLHGSDFHDPLTRATIRAMLESEAAGHGIDHLPTIMRWVVEMGYSRDEWFAAVRSVLVMEGK